MAYAGQLSALVSQYRDKGRKEAAEHRPPIDASVPDNYENELRSTAENYVRTEEQQFRARVIECEQSETNIHEEAQNLRNEIRALTNDNSFKSDVEIQMAEEKKAIEDLAETRIRAEVQYRDFRLKNHVTSEPHYPESHVWHFAIVALCFLFETGANALFFSNSVSLLEGYGFAFGIAAVNISTAMLLGAGFRYKNVSDEAKRFSGWLCFVAFIVLTIWLNALFAAYRSEYEILSNPEDWTQLSSAFRSAMGQAARIFVLKMQIRDLTSFLLFGFGLLLSALAFWKGYTFDDKYPEHGRMHRLVKAERAAESAAYKTLKTKISQIILRHRGRIQAAINMPSDLLRKVNGSYSLLMKSRTELAHQISAIRSDHRVVQEEYRQTNATVRGIPSPHYFETYEPLRTADGLDSIADDVATKLHQSQLELEMLRDEIQGQLSAKLEELNQYHSSIQVEGLKTYGEQIVREAQQRIATSALATSTLDFQAAQ